MTAMKWDQIGERYFETGIDKVGLYLLDSDTSTYKNGVAWSGVSKITESPSGADESKIYADNSKYLGLRAAEDYGCTIEAYQSPKEFDACDGAAELAPGVTIGQQTRQTFGLSFRTLVGNDIKGQDYGYKIHLVYGATASPTSRDYNTVNDSPEAATLSWEVSTTPVEVPGFKVTSHLEIDTRTADATKLAAFEKIIYGDDTNEPRLPLPEEVMDLFKTTTNSVNSGRSISDQ